MFGKTHFILFLLSSLWVQIKMSTMSTMSTISPANAFDDEWWKSAVIYQIYPRSFMDSNGDGVGDLQGIISKLPYLAETGITVTWLSPIFLSPMVDFGYDISDFTAIQPEYGTMADFEQLIAEAKLLGIKVILDFVPNHSSDQCEWFKKSVERAAGFEDFYVWTDGVVDALGERLLPNNWQSVFYGSAWTWSERRQQFYLHQFTAQQPDLNFRNPKVVEAMDDVLRFWLDKGVSGFRVDAVNHLFEAPELTDEPLSGETNDENDYGYTKHIYTKNLPEVYDMVHHWRLLLDEYSAMHAGPARVMMTEAYADLKQLMDYYESAEGVQGAHFPFNFLFITNLSAESEASDFVFNIQKWLIYMPRGHVANWVMGNHDNPRVASRFGTKSVDAMNMLLLTLPGVAVTYNGEEIGMQDFRDITWEDTVDPPALNAGAINYTKVSRDPERTPFQWDSAKNAGFSTAVKTWLPVHPEYERLNLAEQKMANRSHYKVYKALLALRKHPVMRHGRVHIEVLNRKVFAFKRYLKGHSSIITIINVSGQQQASLDLIDLVEDDKKVAVLVAGSASAYETGATISAQGLTLAPSDALILGVGTPPSRSADRRALIRTLLKSANVVLVGLLMYKLWHNKWAKLNINKEPFF